MWRHLLLLTITTGQELVYKYNVCPATTQKDDTLSTSEGRASAAEPDRRLGGISTQVSGSVGGTGRRLGPELCANQSEGKIHPRDGRRQSSSNSRSNSVGTSARRSPLIYSEEEDELAYAACKPADCWIGLEEDGGVPDYLCDGKCGTAETWWGEARSGSGSTTWAGRSDLINRRIGDGLVGYRWRAGGATG